MVLWSKIIFFHYTLAKSTTFTDDSKTQMWYFRPGYGEIVYCASRKEKLGQYAAHTQLKARIYYHRSQRRVTAKVPLSTRGRWKLVYTPWEENWPAVYLSFSSLHGKDFRWMVHRMTEAPLSTSFVNSVPNFWRLSRRNPAECFFHQKKTSFWGYVVMGIWDVYLFSAIESPKFGDSLAETTGE